MRLRAASFAFVAAVSKCLEYVRILLGFSRSSELLAGVTMRPCSPSGSRTFQCSRLPIDNSTSQSPRQSADDRSKPVFERLQPSADLKSFEARVDSAAGFSIVVAGNRSPSYFATTSSDRTGCFQVSTACFQLFSSPGTPLISSRFAAPISY
jgi:hypothetical protein